MGWIKGALNAVEYQRLVAMIDLTTRNQNVSGISKAN